MEISCHASQICAMMDAFQLVAFHWSDSAMRRTFFAAVAIMLVATTPQAQQAHPQKPSPAFDQFHALVGSWVGGMEGHHSLTTFRIVSNNTAIEETSAGGSEYEMVSVYAPDGSKLAMTHYCSAGNQPRMETGAMEGKASEFAFHFTGITNLAKPEEGHMIGLTLKLEDPNHLTETWTWLEAGKTSQSVFHYTRKA